ncbi:MAG: MFS transporter [Pseudomonadota bacterium]
MQKTSWGLVVGLWGAGLGAAAQYGKFSVTFDRLPQIYPDAGTALGLVVSLVGLTGIFLGVAAGLLVARFRYRRALLWALWVGAALSLFQATLPPMPWLLASRALEGLSHLAIVVATPTLIAQLCAPRDLGLALTLWGTFFGVAFALLAWVGLPLADRFGLPALLIAHAFYLALFAVVLARPLGAVQTPRGPALSLRHLIQQHLEIYRSPSILAPAAGWLFYTFCFVSVLTLLPPYLDPGQRALVMGAMPLLSILSSMTLGVWLLRLISPVQVVQFGLVASALTMLWLLASPGNAAACLVLAGTMGLIQGASFAAVPQLNSASAQRAQANGAMAQTGNIGNTLGTPVLVLVLAASGYSGLPITLALAFFSGFCVHLWLAKRRKAR